MLRSSIAARPAEISELASAASRWALAGVASQPPAVATSRWARTCSESRSEVRKCSVTNSPSLVASSTFLRGTSAVCGIGTPIGWRNSAVTANQSARPPTSPASAPAATKPSTPASPPCTSRVMRKTAAKTMSSAVARVLARRSARSGVITDRP